MWSPRIASSNVGANQFGEEVVGFFEYSGVSGSLSIGMPVYLDVRDAAQFNTLYASTALTAGIYDGAPSAGRVNLGTAGVSAVGTVLTCVGIFQPLNIGGLPANGSIIRVLFTGYGLVSASAIAAGTAVTVGSKLVASSASNSALAGTATVGQTIGTVLGTLGADTNGGSIIAVPGSGATVGLVNAFVLLQ